MDGFDKTSLLAETPCIVWMSFLEGDGGDGM